VFGAALSNATIFGINTGFRGETLVNVINQSAISLLLADATTLKEVNRALPDIQVLGSDNILIAGQPVDDPPDTPPDTFIDDQTSGFKHISEVLPAPGVYDRKKSKVPVDNFSPIIVIYTSGTTGAPKGVPCSHLKVLGAGQVIRTRIGLTAEDRGYVCMPLFHSNAWFIALMPLFLSGGSFLLKRRFSARAFEEDVLEHGVTYMNYVGQSVHYILMALEKKYGSGEKVKEALSQHPKNQFRIAHGNGATSVDRKKLIQYLGMEHVYEMYGSTEAPITTVVMPGNPIDSVGEITSKNVVILDEDNQPCPVGILDKNGQLTNYEAAVGEISKKIKKENLFFDGYFKNEGATEKKFRDGYYRSGDLGHICVVDGKRFLYFDGRTDDWIRKDGENFSGENVLPFVLNLPDVELAAAYGSPCAVSDEKVMVSLQLKKRKSVHSQRDL